MKNIALLPLALWLAACTSTASSVQNSLAYPVAARAACRDASGAFRTSGECEAEGGTWLAVVLDLGHEDFKVADLAQGELLDARPGVPGYNGWRFAGGGVPRDVAVEEGGDHLVAALANPDRLVRFDLKGGEVLTRDLPQAARSLAWVDAPEGALLAAAYEGTNSLELLDPQTLETIHSLALPREPERVLASPTAGVVAWTYRDAAWIGWGDLSQGGFTDLPLLAACEDGVDNDGDGRTDLADAGCQHAWDLSEEGTAGTGGQCANGLDDDGDGAIDLADAGCSGPNGDAEATDQLFCSTGDDGRPHCGTRLFSFACSDGLDNDGDGATDADDPDCASPFGLWEDGARLPGGTRAAFLPDGLHLVVADARRGAVQVVDLETGEVGPTREDSPLRRFERTPGVLLPTTVIDLAASAKDGDSVRFYALGLDGFAYRMRAAKAEPQWLLSIVELAETNPNGTLKPLLTVNGSSVEVGLTSPSAYPGFGVMEVIEQAGQPTLYYGITPSADAASLRAEVWTLGYEGLIPHSASRAGVLDAAGGALVDPLADFCELGVEPGDWLLLTFPGAEEACGELRGGEWQARVTGVSRDRVTLDAAALTAIDSDGAVDPAKPAGSPSGACGRTGVEYRLLAGDAFLAVGSRTGLLHNRTSRNGLCVERPDADPLFTGRVQVARPLEEGLLVGTCPSVGNTGDYQAFPFSNPSFSLSMYPGCERLASQEYRPVAPTRGITWRFTTTGGVQPYWIGTGGAPTAITWIEERSALFVSDPGKGSAYTIIDLDESGASTDTIFY